MRFRAIGSLAVNNWGAVQDNLQWQSIYMAMPGTPGSVTSPVDFTDIWHNGNMNAAVWRPTAPEGYESVGDIWTKGWDKAPDLESVYVIKKDCVVPCQQTPQLIGYGMYGDYFSSITKQLHPSSMERS